MKLIDLLVKELPKCGGWPEGARETIEMHMDGGIFFDGDCAPDEFTLPQCSNGWAPGMGRFSNEVTREQYDSALAASDGWIEWGGGECPVQESVNVDVKLEDGSEKSDAPACSFIWQHSEDVYAIIAYRLHKSDINSRANDDRLELDLNECIGQDVDMPEWNGEGLPPVGCECKIKFIGDTKPAEWFSFKLIGVHDEIAIVTLDGENTWQHISKLSLDKVKFRPLRTEAEKLRDLAVDDITKSMGVFGVKSASELLYADIAAGKIRGVKLEVK